MSNVWAVMTTSLSWGAFAASSKSAGENAASGTNGAGTHAVPIPGIGDLCPGTDADIRAAGGNHPAQPDPSDCQALQPEMLPKLNSMTKRSAPSKRRCPAVLAIFRMFIRWHHCRRAFSSTIGCRKKAILCHPASAWLRPRTTGSLYSLFQ